jgi:ABC-2 type transport system permease protein
MPLTYSVDSLKQVTTNTEWTSALTWDLVIVASFGIAALLLGSATIRRKL